MCWYYIIKCIGFFKFSLREMCWFIFVLVSTKDILSKMNRFVLFWPERKFSLFRSMGNDFIDLIDFLCRYKFVPTSTNLNLLIKSFHTKRKSDIFRSGQNKKKPIQHIRTKVNQCILCSAEQKQPTLSRANVNHSTIGGSFRCWLNKTSDVV